MNDTRKTVAAPPPSIDLQGIWRSERGSEMHLNVHNTQLSGTYSSKVGDAGDEDIFLLTGFASNDLISFVVNFGKFRTLTAWVGQYGKDANGSDALHTSFIAVLDVEDADEAELMWGSVRTGTDVFSRVS